MLRKWVSVSLPLASPLRPPQQVLDQLVPCCPPALEFTLQPRLGTHLSVGARGSGHQRKPTALLWQGRGPSPHDTTAAHPPPHLPGTVTPSGVLASCLPVSLPLPVPFHAEVVPFPAARLAHPTLCHSCHLHSGSPAPTLPPPLPWLGRCPLWVPPVELPGELCNKGPSRCQDLGHAVQPKEPGRTPSEFALTGLIPGPPREQSSHEKSPNGSGGWRESGCEGGGLSTPQSGPSCAYAGVGSMLENSHLASVFGAGEQRPHRTADCPPGQRG